MPASILIADDHEVVLKGLKALLGEKFIVVGEARNGHEAVAMAKRFNPDIVLMDAKMPQMGGVEATREIKSFSPQTKVLILSTFNDDKEIFSSIEAGASGYVFKDLSSTDLIKATQAVCQGQSFFHPAVAAKISGRFRELSKKLGQGGRLASDLTQRELEVLKLLGEGFNNKAIAKTLYISLNTVKTHISHILRKLGREDRTQAALYSLRKGLIQ